jgi:hypothetical protein
LSIFVKQDGTTHPEETRISGKERHELTSALLSSYGTGIDEHYLVPTTTDKDDNDDGDDSDSDDDADAGDDDGRA